MIPHRLYLGTWLPRTSIHLKEIFRFLHAREGVRGLSQEKINKLRDALQVSDFALHEELDTDYLEGVFAGGKFMVTEDGILLVKTDEFTGDADWFGRAKDLILNYHTEKLGPALNYLFSRGAPIPRDLAHIKTVLPLVAVVSGAADAEIQALHDIFAEKRISVIRGEGLEIHRSASLTIMNFGKEPQNGTVDNKIEKFVESNIFFRDFEFQLEEYLTRHRAYWDEISKIRDSHSLRYRDFPNIRKKLLEIRRSITYVDARLSQMGDILKGRANTLSAEEKEFLQKFGLNRFEPLGSAQAYTKHLWEMTHEYLEGTIILLHNLYEENSQKELAVIKVTTFAAAMVGFFGMNIPFPWNEEWTTLRIDSVIVALLTIAIPIALYFILQYTVLHRRFSLGGGEGEERR